MVTLLACELCTNTDTVCKLEPAVADPGFVGEGQARGQARGPNQGAKLEAKPGGQVRGKQGVSMD